MNISFPPIGKDFEPALLPTDLAVMLVGIAARQAASPTALFQSRIAENPTELGLLAPPHGAFSHAMADLLKRWKVA